MHVCTHIAKPIWIRLETEQQKRQEPRCTRAESVNSLPWRSLLLSSSLLRFPFFLAALPTPPVADSHMAALGNRWDHQQQQHQAADDHLLLSLLPLLTVVVVVALVLLLVLMSLIDHFGCRDPHRLLILMERKSIRISLSLVCPSCTARPVSSIFGDFFDFVSGWIFRRALAVDDSFIASRIFCRKSLTFQVFSEFKFLLAMYCSVHSCVDGKVAWRLVIQFVKNPRGCQVLCLLQFRAMNGCCWMCRDWHAYDSKL